MLFSVFVYSLGKEAENTVPKVPGAPGLSWVVRMSQVQRVAKDVR